MAESCLLSLPSLCYGKIKYPCLFTPSKPLKLQAFFSNSSLCLSSLSLSRKTHHSCIVTFVAQTSDWAQQGEDITLAVEEEEEEAEQDESAWEKQDGAEASLSGWESEGGGAGIDGSQGELERGEDGGSVEPPQDAQVFVGNLPYDVDSQKLAMLFEKAGTVEIAKVIYSRRTDLSRGFGFVTMSTVEEAENAVEKFNHYDLDGRLLTISKAAPRGSRPERPPRTFKHTFRVFVGNLPWNVDNALLEQVFIEHGKVVSARIVYDRHTGRSRGYGFVTMTSETEMNDAIAALDGQSLDGRVLRVQVYEDRPRRTGSF